MGLLNDAEEKLTVLGIRHAPIQQCRDSTDVDGRYVVLTTPKGVYYLLSTDSPDGDFRRKNWIQLLYWGIDLARVSADLNYLGWRHHEEGELPCSEPHPDGYKMHYVILAPPQALVLDPPRQLSAA